MASQKPIPIHERSLIINPQDNSPLFSLIPAELRSGIFDYALTEYTRTDEDSLYPVDTRYTRPGYTGKRSVCTSILLACRRSYMETYHLPPTRKEHIFWHMYRPASEITDTEMTTEKPYFGHFADWQLKLVKEIHLFTQMFWLERDFPKMCPEDFMQGIEKVTITIRRTDWWYNENNEELRISPQRSNSESMYEVMGQLEAEERGEQIPWELKAWGSAFAQLGSLKELVMELETSDDKKDELMTIVKKAKGWRFPYKNGAVLSAKGFKEEVSTWRGPMCYWSDICPYCDPDDTCETGGASNEGCVERTRLKDEGKGPLCYVVKLRWVVVNKA